MVVHRHVINNLSLLNHSLQSQFSMSMLDKFRKGAQKAGIQATAFLQDSSSKVVSGSREFAHGFSLPGEAEKAANILDSFLGEIPSIISWIPNIIVVCSRPATATICAKLHSESCSAASEGYDFQIMHSLRRR